MDAQCRRDQPKLEPLLVRLPSDLLRELREIAETEDRSIAGILRTAAKEFVARHKDA